MTLTPPTPPPPKPDAERWEELSKRLRRTPINTSRMRIANSPDIQQYRKGSPTWLTSSGTPIQD